jgi:molybdate transport system substrate-binding protein
MTLRHAGRQRNYLAQISTIALVFWAVSSPATCHAEAAIVAVATNFKLVADQAAEIFNAETGHRITIAAGATGKLAAQITSGAPFDLFLAADTQTPARLIAEGLADPDSARTYALGALVLWAPDAEISDPKAALEHANHIAIANPALAPYGRAARETLAAMGLTEIVAPKLVTGENIGQTYALVASGAADIGFVAASTGAKGWRVPEALHAPIAQDLVLLTHGAQNEAARAFKDWLFTADGQGLMVQAGYALPSETAPK